MNQENRTVVGIFDSAADAQKAVAALTAAGFSRDSYDIASREAGATTATATTPVSGRDSDHYNESGTMVEGAADAVGRGAEHAGSAIGRFFDNLFGGSDRDSVDRYSRVAGGSQAIVTVHCHSDENARQASDILDDNGAVDVDERAAQYATGAPGTTGVAAGRDAVDGAQSAQVIREDLHVGKREVTTGGARLRSRIVERPVEENLRLREEHVFVNREPVDRPATDADFAAFREGTMELKETAEVPVVQKEARVVEEVRLGKEATERTETIRDTVRSTEVEVERLDGRDAPRTDDLTNR